MRQETRNPKLETRNPEPETLPHFHNLKYDSHCKLQFPRSYTLNHLVCGRAQGDLPGATRNLKSGIQEPKLETRNPKP